jgi:hypothetical protein
MNVVLPLQWPQTGDHRARDRHAASTERLLKGAIVLAFLALTIFDRFGLRLTAAYSIPPGIVAMYGLVAAMVFAGAAELNLRGALAYLAVASSAALSFIVNASVEPRPYISITSFLLVMVFYAPFAVSFGSGAAAPKLWHWTANLYIGFAVFIALAGIVQFFAQFVFRPEWLFDYTQLIPAPVRGSGGWNTVNSTGSWVKSNGFFLREPSIFSVAMAFALLCESSLARRKWVMAMLALALLLTYSGSGLLCLAVGMLFPMGRGTVVRVLAFAVLAAATFFLVGDALNLSYTLNRIDEFASERSSAYCRFVYPGAVVVQQIDSSPWTSLLGHGPGTMERMGATCADGAQTTYAKVLFEYGLVGTLAFGVLIFGALYWSAAPIRIRVALGVTWLLLGGNLLASEALLFIYILAAMWPESMAPAVKSEASRASSSTGPT